MYKKIYVEITNNCNLACSFCIKNKRIKKNMSFEKFKIVLNKIKKYTNYIYLHVLGEPLLHPEINKFIDYASKYFKVNITTNGYLINNILNNRNIRQINISLQSYDSKYGISLEQYMNNIFKTVDILKENTFISYRFWVKNKYSKDILNMINKKYDIVLDIDDIKNNSTINKNIFISINEEFNWPNLNNKELSENGTCYALKDHIGILVDGTVVPCCLDSMGIIRLGNIFHDDLDTIIGSSRYQNMFESFKNNKKCEELCRRCNYLDKKI